MPVVSIIIPVYNAEKYLWDCLNSVSQQLFSDFEVILVDDGSIDSSGKICDEYACIDSRFSVLHTENRGVASARNTGLDYANGDWIVFVDSDDTVNPGYLSQMLEVVDPKTDLVLCDLLGREKVDMNSLSLDPETFEDHPSLLMGYPYNKLYRLSIIREYKLQFPLGLSTMEDNIFVWSYLEKCRFVSISKASNYVYNQHVNSLAHSVHNINEIHKLSTLILPVYERLQAKFNFQSIVISRCDKYLFVACLKRMLISSCTGMSISQIKDILLDTFSRYNAMICRMRKIKDTSFIDRALLFLIKNKCANILSLYTKMSSFKKH